LGFLAALLVLSFLIFFHELGHFLAARFFGVKVEVFSIGFGTKLFSVTRGGTQYAVSSIPLGGYVKMKGQNDANPNERSGENDSYGSKTPLQRVFILLAGPFFNLALAAIIYFGLALSGVDMLTGKIGEISKDSAAQSAGLQRGDRILSINGEKIEFWHQISDIIPKTEGRPVSVVIKRDLQVIQIQIKPRITESKNIFGENTKRYMLGIAPYGETTKIYYKPIDAIFVSIEKTYESAKFIVMGVEKLITGVLSLDNVGGVVSIVQATNEATNTSFMALMLLTALISVNLGVINLLPIPALDGGHIIFNIYEMIFKKPPSEAVFTKLTIAGWAILLWLMLLGLYNDLNRLAGGF